MAESEYVTRPVKMNQVGKDTCNQKYLNIMGCVCDNCFLLILKCYLYNWSFMVETSFQWFKCVTSYD